MSGQQKTTEKWLLKVGQTFSQALHHLLQSCIGESMNAVTEVYKIYISQMIDRKTMKLGI